MKQNLVVNDNKFTDFFGCFTNIPNCLVGYFFPFCLFGHLFKKAEFGNFLTGCCSYFLIQSCISFFFNSLYLILFLTIMPLNNVFYEKCNQNSTCYYQNITFIDDNCKVLPNSSSLNYNNTCSCFINNQLKKCNWDESLKKDGFLIGSYGFLIYFFYILTFYSVTGFFLGIYRTKIAYKYNITTNRRINCLVHTFPLCNQLALCQESNTIDFYETNPIITLPVVTNVQVIDKDTNEI